MRSADLRSAANRLRVVGGFLVAAFLVLAARAAYLSVIDERGAQLGRMQTGTVLRLAPARGAIVDRRGRELAVTVLAPSVYAVPRAVEDPAAAARALSRALGLPASSLQKRLSQRSSFVFLGRWLSAAQAQAVSKLDLAGVGIVQEPRRTYPNASLAGRLLGFANIDGKGVRGVEQREDSWLRGSDQKVAVERDARRRFLANGSVDPQTAAGGEIRLTLDAALQGDAELALEGVVKATGARGGSVIALDPGSGDLLALAEYPSIDPNNFRKANYQETGSHAFLDALEPGSTFKTFTIAAALEQGVLRLDEQIDCEHGRWRVRGGTLHDSHEYDLLDPTSILRVSSNICTAKIGYRMKPAAHYEALRRFGFGQKTESGFPDESPGILRKPGGWKELDHATISFGQGVNITPVQLAAAMAALANGGVWRAPRIVAARRRAGEPWQETGRGPSRRALREDVARTTLGMLETVLGEGGTGGYAALQGVRVAGKTGTAQKLDPASGRYSQHAYLGWFAGIAPADDPRVVVVVMLDEPRGRVHTGGYTAGPLFAEVAAAALARQGVWTAPERALPDFARVDGGHTSDPPRLAPASVAAPPPLEQAPRDAEHAPAAAPARSASAKPLAAEIDG